MRELYKLYLAISVCISLGLTGCAADPSLGDPYENNNYFWPYESAAADVQASPTIGSATSCSGDPTAPLGRLADGTAIVPMTNCEQAPEGSFPICASFSESGQLQVKWEGINGFAIYVTEPQAIIPSAPNTPVAEGETFWSIGPIDFPTEGFASPLTYQDLPQGMADVTTEHGGPNGGSVLTSGRCYKITVVNKIFLSASVIVGWQ